MRSIIVTALVVVVLLGVLAGVFLMRPHAPRPANTAPPPAPATSAEHTAQPVTPPAGQPELDRVRQILLDALRTATDKPSASPFPEGTRLTSVKLEGDLAVVDLSSEFGNVAHQGDSGESAAQQALRAALARVPEVHRMRVLVDGKQFEGEHSGPWDSVPVRDDAGSRS